ncbi:MAG: nicotinate-nucleotide diphosphorylase (carboxylating), partial [Ruminococcus sp.]
MKLLQCYIDNIITTALMEDINYMDAAADNLIPPEHKSSAYYVAKDTGVVCGIEIAGRVFDLAGGNVDFRILKNDGSKVEKGDIIAEM